MALPQHGRPMTMLIEAISLSAWIKVPPTSGSRATGIPAIRSVG